ncbi:MAG: hypothetical protein DRJ52_10220 [Thermoprotei archaeon]|nr:MAG: hypothetical protein DRJ52_10220 [Thermoprotei archaeon]RLF00195.1 MAG: hypothetical protein DRJ63_03210 [Thermoprotei archaeon]HDI75063.1 hypothetical protein [Thermoprotei archaeon]
MMNAKNILKIVSHNAFWFQGSSFTGEKPGEPSKEVLERLIEIYSLLNPDVLCLQEVQSRKVAEDISEKLNMKWFYAPGVLFREYGGAIFLKRYINVLDYQYSRENITRMWQKLKIKLASGETLVLCNIHLPSGRLLGEKSSTYRLHDLEQVFIKGEYPDIIVGDFNEPPWGLVYEYMLAKEYTDIAMGEEPTILRGLRVDYIWVRKKVLKTVLDYFVYKNMLLTEKNIFLSDHYPIVAVIALE